MRVPSHLAVVDQCDTHGRDLEGLKSLVEVKVLGRTQAGVDDLQTMLQWSRTRTGGLLR